MDVTQETLDIVFGQDSSGSTPEERAKTSHREFVRSQDELAIYASPATGRRLSAWEALKAFGFDKLYEAVTNSSAVLVNDFRRPALLFRERRQRLGLEPADLAKRLSVPPTEIAAAENFNNRTTIQLLERIAQVLGLDETQLVNANARTGDPELAVRLRELRRAHKNFGPRTVLTFDEAAWVVSKQNLLYSWIHPRRKTLADWGFVADSRYGGPGYPAWKYGYDLADVTRRNLGLSATEPIRPLKRIVEEVLCIPVVYARLPQGIAGATISNGSDRGIIVNVDGQNQNVWVRRMTIAHELGHLLWDPDPRLTKLRVDSYKDFEERLFDLPDPVEARANAFAVQFLAPRSVVREIYNVENNPAQVRKIMIDFGVSFTSGKYQIWNSLDRTILLDSIRTDDVEPTDDWRAEESYTLDFFQPATVPEMRTGYFAGLVAAAEKRHLISADSAAAFLGCSERDYLDHAGTIRSLYPVSE